MTNEVKSILDPNFAVVVVELQRMVREGWFIADTPSNNFTMYEIPMQRNKDSIRAMVKRSEEIKSEPKEPIEDRMAKVRAARLINKTKETTNDE